MTLYWTHGKQATHGRIQDSILTSLGVNKTRHRVNHWSHHRNREDGPHARKGRDKYSNGTHQGGLERCMGRNENTLLGFPHWSIGYIFCVVFSLLRIMVPALVKRDDLVGLIYGLTRDEMERYMVSNLSRCFRNMVSNQTERDYYIHGNINISRKSVDIDIDKGDGVMDRAEKLGHLDMAVTHLLVLRRRIYDIHGDLYKYALNGHWSCKGDF